MIKICFNNVYILNVVVVVLKKLDFYKNACVLMVELTMNGVLCKITVHMYSSYTENVFIECFIFSPVIISSLLPCPHAAYVYCSEVMRWLGYGNRTGRYVDT